VKFRRLQSINKAAHRRSQRTVLELPLVERFLWMERHSLELFNGTKSSEKKQSASSFSKVQEVSTTNTTASWSDSGLDPVTYEYKAKVIDTNGGDTPFSGVATVFAPTTSTAEYDLAWGIEDLSDTSTSDLTWSIEDEGGTEDSDLTWSIE